MKNKNYFTKAEWLLWSISMTAIILAYLLFAATDVLTLIASLVGVTALILCAKGNPWGQVLIILFSGLYGYISFFCAYYGEMITYLGMSAPMALLALIAWLRHPYQGNHSQVSVNRVHRKEVAFMLVLSLVVTAVFYFILKEFGTAALLPSTLSVTTSFLAAYLTFRRSPYYALAYAANDLVLIVLWILAAVKDVSYLSVIVCFAAFLVNDLYGFSSWLKMEKAQQNSNCDQ